MFERFTERARQVVVLAQDEARVLKHNYIGTEHILLGLLREDDGLAARVLESFGITVTAVRGQVGRIVGQGDEVTTGQIPFTPRAKRVLELSLREAQSLGHNYIGTEHILLGLARENEGVASRILLDFHADAASIRDVVLDMLSGAPGPRGLTLVERQAAESNPELAAELERVRGEKVDAIEAQDLLRASALRAEERRLRRELLPQPRSGAQLAARDGGPWTDSAVAVRHGFERLPITIGAVVAAVGFPLGLVVGWLIWG